MGFCLNHVGYFDWLVTGFGMLSEQGNLDWRFATTLANLFRYKLIRRGSKFISRKLVASLETPAHCMTGRVDFGGKVVRFAMDVTDYSWNYNERVLSECDVYFKCQFPKGFPNPVQLNRQVNFPFSEVVQQHAHKIKPAMLGRPLSVSLNYLENARLLRQFESMAEETRTQKLFAYYGTDRMDDVHHSGPSLIVKESLTTQMRSAVS